MATVYFPSLNDADVVQVEFVKPAGDIRSASLLVDSGFTGQSCFVLPETVGDELFQASVPPSQALGALRGLQNRAWVICRIPALSFERTLIAILGDLSPLSLPPGLDGLAGLRFLRQFASWGAEQTQDGHWRFFLSDAKN